jgi:hypothetical protein
MIIILFFLLKILFISFYIIINYYLNNLQFKRLQYKFLILFIIKNYQEVNI